MRKCPNCSQTTARTTDWACQWCGYPLLSKSYKKVPKTYRQLKEEKRYKPGLNVSAETELSLLPGHVALPRVFYGWVMVILAMFIMGAYSITFYTFGIFLRPVTMEFGWERGAISVAQSITMLVGGGLGIFTGRLCDKYGPRPLATAVGVVGGVAFLLMSRIDSLWQVYLIWGLLMGITLSCCVIPISSTIPRWFTKRRGVAIGLTQVGFGLGGVISPPLAQWLISSYGWQQAYITLGFIILVIAIPVAQFMKHSPQRIGLKPYGEENKITDRQSPTSEVGGLTLKETIKTGRFWIFVVIQFSFMFCLQVIVVHIAPHAVDMGILAIIAASIVSIIAAVSLFGRVAIGFISDRIGPRPALVACFALFILALTWLLFAKEVWMFYVFAAIFGIAYGMEIPLLSLVPAELFGLRYLGIIAGTTMFVGSIGGAIGAPLAGAIFDVTGSYRSAFLIGITLYTLAIILSLVLLRSKSLKDTVKVE